MKHRRLSTAFLVVFVAAIHSVPCVASESAADALAARGIELRKEGRDQDALPFFLQALQEHPSPKSLTQVGLCQQAVGLWVDAEKNLLKALESPADSWIRKNDHAIRQALSFVQDRLGEVEVWGTPTGAAIQIDGVDVARLPTTTPLRVPIGRRVLSVHALGFVSESRVLEVRSTARLREHVVLVSTNISRAPQPTSPAADLAGRVSASKSPETGNGSEPVGSASVPLYGRWWFWTLVGAAVVAGGVSTYLVWGRNESCSAPMESACGKW